MFFRRIYLAFQHVRTGGQSTKTRARRRAAAPPMKCPTCHQPIKHSDDYRDHIELDTHYQA